ncbi:MAG: glycosyltransferase family 2 protein [Deltaproteobacteria bacterium]|nr:glycosyltransferase family 2 protein [Deltaproteobacteria bacterium]MBN2673293.1 glycosyltransferase family 2 protein [Deltaproteobacteria bacterium]
MNLCILLPTYNNVSTLLPMVEELAGFQLPMVVVNDGSGASMKPVFEQLEKRADVTVVHRTHNGGKGAAVRDGIRWAQQSGYTHVLQMDADRQHAVEDVPRFLEAASANPEFLILGKPIFPANTPISRLNGRKISIIWVWIETLSKAIEDPLFGFRVYPVPATVRALRSPFLGKRMDFDPEVAVRLVWAGVPVQTIETPVTYHEDGVSHFRLFYDNVLISWMHTRLFFGMLIRSWKLIGRRIFKRKR